MDYTETSDYKALLNYDNGLGANFKHLSALGCRNFHLIELDKTDHRLKEDTTASGSVRIQFESPAQKLAFVEQCLKGLSDPDPSNQQKLVFYTDWKWIERNRPKFAAMLRKPVLKADCIISCPCSAEWIFNFEKALGKNHSFIIVSENRVVEPSSSKSCTKLEILVFYGPAPDLMAINALTGLSPDRHEGALPLQKQLAICSELESLGVCIRGANPEMLFFLLPIRVSKQEEEQISRLLGALSDELATDQFRDWGVRSLMETTRFLAVSRIH